MITNERQYRVTKSQAERFRRAIETFDEKGALAKGIDPLIVRAQLNALKSQYEELAGKVAEYEEMTSSRRTSLSASGVDELPELLIKARIIQGLSQRELAGRLGMKEQQIQRYEAERYQGASLHRLGEIAEALKINCTITMELEDCDGEHECQSDATELVARLLDGTTIKEMRKRQWLYEFADKCTGSDDNHIAYFLMQSAFQGNINRALHRKLDRPGTNVGALLAWQARVLMKARTLSSKVLRPVAWDDPAWIQSLVRLSVENNGPILAREFLWEKGIIVVFERQLPRTYLDGAAMLLDGAIPVIGLTLRQNRLDNFWFVLLHEVAHLFLHRRRGLELGFLDEKAEEGLHEDELEHEADRFAQTALIPDEAWNSSMAKFVQSDDEVRSLARRFGVGVSVVAGRLRRERRNYQLFSRLVGQGEVRKLFANEETV